MRVTVYQTAQGFEAVGPSGAVITDRTILEQIEFDQFVPPSSYFNVILPAINTLDLVQNTIYINIAPQ